MKFSSKVMDKPKTKLILFYLLLFILVGLSSVMLYFSYKSSHKTQNNLQAEKTIDLSNVLKSLKTQTTLPVRLPNTLPPNGEATIYPQLGYVDDSQATIYLDLAADCNGATACHSMTIQIFKQSRFLEGDTVNTSLHKNIAGSYHIGACIAYCSDSQIIWAKDNLVYELSIKGGQAEDLTGLANYIIDNS